jgi:hypothetical protein
VGGKGCAWATAARKRKNMRVMMSCFIVSLFMRLDV